MHLANAVRVLVILFALGSMSAPLRGQSRVLGVDSLLATLRPEQRIRVRFVGVDERERVWSFSRNPSMLHIPNRRPSAAALQVDSVWTLARHGQQRRGAIIGGLTIGAFFGVVSGALSCYEGCGSGQPAAGAVGGFLFGGLLGGLTGGLIGRAFPKTEALVYARRQP